MLNVGRIGLTHPDLGTAGGSALWTQINTIYQTLGDAISGRLFTGTALASGGTATFTHGFQVAFAEVHYRLYAYNHSTGAIGAQITTGWTVIANVTNPTTQVDVTNSSGSPADFALVMIHDGNRKLSEQQDVDFSTSPQDGQALVYDGVSSTWKPGASGDASFKLQSVATPNLVLKGGGNSGGLFLGDGRVLKTYSGSGSTSASYGVDLTMSLTTILGTTPANATGYWLAVDLDTLGAQQTISDTLEKVYQVTISNFVLLTSDPLLQNRARYASIGEIKSATTGNAWSGTGSAFRTLPVRLVQNIPSAVSPIASRPATGLAVGAVGSSGQIAAGHVLSSKSFPSAAAGTFSWYNLAAAGTTDGSGNARTLTAEGTPTSATGILGTAAQATALNGTSQDFTSASSFFMPAAANSYGFAGWFKATNWVTGTPQTMASNNAGGGGSSVGFILGVDSTGLLNVSDTADGTAAGIQQVNGPTLTGSAWHHIAYVYEKANNQMKLYLDGNLAGVISMTRTAAATTFVFRIGARNTSTLQWFGGTVEECVFFSGYAPTAQDITKLASYRYDHNAAVAVANQRWYAAVYPNGGEPVYQPSPSWLISKGDTNSVFWNFNDLGSTDMVDVILEDLGLSPVMVTPVPPFDTTYTSDPSGTIAHGQPDVPEVIVLQETGTAGQWVELAPMGLVAADATNLVVTTTGLVTVGASPNRLRIIARPARLATVGVPDANNGRSGVVTTSRQTFAGPKVGQDGLASASNIRSSEGAGTTTFTDADNRFQTFNLTAARTAILPSTGVIAGERWMIENRGAFDLTIQPSGGGTIDVIQVGYVILEALQVTPTSTAHWRIVDVYEVNDSAMSATTFSGNLGGAASSSVALTLTRRNRIVTIGIPSKVDVTPTTSSTFLVANTAIPSRMRPLTATKSFITNSYNSGAFVNTTLGHAELSTAGIIGFYRDVSATAYTNSAAAGWVQTTFCYSID